MKFTVNGDDFTVEVPCTVETLLEGRGLRDRPCAVEVNTELVPKARHAGHELHEGDRVEIVTLVGGG